MKEPEQDGREHPEGMSSALGFLPRKGGGQAQDLMLRPPMEIARVTTEQEHLKW